MPFRTASQVKQEDPFLTTVVQGYMNGDFVGTSLFPEVEVTTRTGKVVVFDKEDFALYDTRRAPGAPMRSRKIRYGSAPYELYQDALEGELPIEEQEEAAEVPGIQLQRETAESTQASVALRLECDIADMATDAANYDSDHKETISTSSARWSHYGTRDGDSTGIDAVNPIEDVADWHEAIRSSCGRYATTGVMGAKVFQFLQNNPHMLSRRPSGKDSVTLDVIRDLFNLKELKIGTALRLNPETNELEDVWGPHFVMGYVPTLPNNISQRSRRTPAFAYTYRLRGYPVAETPYYERKTRTWYFPVIAERKPHITAMGAGFLGLNVVGDAVTFN